MLPMNDYMVVAFIMSIYLVTAVFSSALGVSIMDHDRVEEVRGDLSIDNEGWEGDIGEKGLIRQVKDFVGQLWGVVKTTLAFVTFQAPIPGYVQLFTFLPLNLILFLSLFRGPVKDIMTIVAEAIPL